VSDDLTAEEAYEHLYQSLVRAHQDVMAAELKFWHDQANYWMGQYAIVIGEY
jgi:hypothetical protein